MSEAILVLNAGSSSIKFSVFGAGKPPQLLLRGHIEALATAPAFRAVDARGRTAGEKNWGSGAVMTHSDAADFLLSWGRSEGWRGSRAVAAGHRVVHGGVKHDRPVRIDDDVLSDLRALIPLAPLHQPHNLAAIDAVAALAPDLP